MERNGSQYLKKIGLPGLAIELNIFNQDRPKTDGEVRSSGHMRLERNIASMARKQNSKQVELN
jgi:hypothetical protein